MNASTVETPSYRVAIIGAGIGGVCMGIKLLKAGIKDFVIFEKASGVSGTWYDHTYPGLVCDVPSHLYSYSFALNPDWSRVFSPQPEIRDYVQRCFDEHRLASHTRLNTEIATAEFDAENAVWRIETVKGEAFHAQFVVGAVGVLRRPSVPEIPGKDTFVGRQFHTSQWPADLDLDGKRVAIMGTAASAIQIVPEIAPKVSRLYVLQRTAHWISPRPDFAYPRLVKTLFRVAPFLMRLHRWMIYGLLDFVVFRSFKRVSWLRRWREWATIRYIRQSVPDPALQEKLIPYFAMGCKRILFSSDYYPALTQPNVELITDGVAAIRADGIQTAGGVVLPVDVIIYATGYEALNPLGPLDFTGLDGISLHDIWRDRMYAHKGVSVPGFPNLLFLQGPNTGLGHSSIIFMLEQQANYAVQCIQQLKFGQYMDVRSEITQAYNARIQGDFTDTVWATGCRSWYLDTSGHNPTLWPHSTTAFWRMMRRPNFADYEIADTKQPQADATK